MNITKYKNAVTSKIARQGLKIQKKSPTLMFAAGIVGFGATVVLASKATLKLEGILDEHEAKMSGAKGLVESGHPDYSVADYRQDKAVLMLQTTGKLVKNYGPALIVGTVSVGLLTGSHVVMQRRNEALMAAFTGVYTAFNEYRARVVDELGAEKDLHFRHGTEEKELYSEKKNGEPVVDIVKVPPASAGSNLYARFFEPSNPSFQPNAETNIAWLKMHERYLNQRLQANGHVFLNEAYDALGLPRSPEGQIVGWKKENHPDEICPISFGLWDDDRMDTFMEFLAGRTDHLLLDFNVDGPVYRDI